MNIWPKVWRDAVNSSVYLLPISFTRLEFPSSTCSFLFRYHFSAFEYPPAAALSVSLRSGHLFPVLSKVPPNCRQFKCLNFLIFFFSFLPNWLSIFRLAISVVYFQFSILKHTQFSNFYFRSFGHPSASFHLVIYRWRLSEGYFLQESFLRTFVCSFHMLSRKFHRKICQNALAKSLSHEGHNLVVQSGRPIWRANLDLQVLKCPLMNRSLSVPNCWDWQLARPFASSLQCLSVLLRHSESQSGCTQPVGLISDIAGNRVRRSISRLNFIAITAMRYQLQPLMLIGTGGERIKQPAITHASIKIYCPARWPDSRRQADIIKKDEALVPF